MLVFTASAGIPQIRYQSHFLWFKILKQKHFESKSWDGFVCYWQCYFSRKWWLVENLVSIIWYHPRSHEQKGYRHQLSQSIWRFFDQNHPYRFHNYHFPEDTNKDCDRSRVRCKNDWYREMDFINQLWSAI